MTRQAQLVVDKDEPNLTYVEQYGLAEAPFTLTPNPRFVYQSRSHSAAFSEVLRSINRREGLIVITGEIGAGKTTLCRRLLEHLTSRTFASVILNPLLSADDLLKQVLSDFGLVSADTVGTAAVADRSWHDLVTMLHRFLASLIQIDAHAVIIIDEAQHLDPGVLEQIRLLSNFETSTAKLLQIILLGQPDLDSLLQRPDMRQLAQRVARRCHLEPLTPAEVGRYIERRLWVAHGGPAVAGAGGPPTPSDQDFAPAEFWRVRFTPAAVRVVADLSAGIPRIVNLLCDRALEIGADSEQRAIGPHTVLAAARHLALPIPAIARLTRGRSLVAVGTAMVAAIATVLLWVAWPSLLTRSGPAPAPTTVAPRDGNATPPSTSTATPIAASATPDGRESGTVGTLETADGYMVVVASFKTTEPANKVMAQAANLGLPAFVRLAEPGGWNIVLVGPYVSRDEAVVAQQQLTQSGLPDSVIIVVRRHREG